MSVAKNKIDIIIGLLALMMSSSLLAQDSIATSISFKSEYRRPIALKTNLLFDMATALNLELEMPIAPRWSVAGEWIFPWWVWERKQHCLQVISGNLELRYWLRPKFTKQQSSLGRWNPLTGWFAGIYGGAGLYDIEWRGKGYQGDFMIASGLSMGYVYPLTRNLSMEYSLGVGYLKTNYTHYEAKQDLAGEWHLIKQHPGRYSWLGPTKAKISLIWYPHFKLKNRGR